MDAETDFSQLKGSENPPPVDTGERIPMTEEHMRYLYGILMAEAPRVALDSNYVEGIRAEVQRAFEMTRHGLLINNEVVKDGVQFRESCESTAGTDPVDTSLLDKVCNLHAEMDSVLVTLMKLKHEVPAKALKRFLATPTATIEVPKRPIVLPDVKVSPQVSECKQALEELSAIQEEIQSVERQIEALSYV